MRILINLLGYDIKVFLNLSMEKLNELKSNLKLLLIIPSLLVILLQIKIKELSEKIF